LKGYFAAITGMDRAIGRLLDRLDALGLRENTLVVFLADNGFNLGHHGIIGKGNGTFPLNMTEESVRVPFIISRPGHVPHGLHDGLWSQYDFRPTLLNYLGLDDPEADVLPGRSFAGVLRGEPDAGREDVVIFDEYGPTRMIRERAWKYVHRYPDGPHELYDLESDPSEKTNLADDADHAPTLARLRSKLEDWFRQYADPARDGAGLPVTGLGQTTAVGEGRDGEAFAQADKSY
jgi:arylsulfatase A-like enzyme